MSNVIHIKTKTICRVCGNEYTNENLELGMCHGMSMIEIPWTKEDYENERYKIKLINELIERSERMQW